MCLREDEEDVPSQQAIEAEWNLCATAQSGSILTGGRGVWLWFRKDLSNQLFDRSVTGLVGSALLAAKAQIDRLPMFIVRPRLPTRENGSPQESRRDDLEEIHEMLLGGWRPRLIAVSVLLLRDLQEFPEFGDGFRSEEHTS